MTGTAADTDLPRPHLRDDGRATLHGTAVAREGRGLLVLGPSGAGKSGLAAETLLMGAQLVADDLLLLEARDAMLWVSAPNATADDGLEATGHGASPYRTMELRGIGIVPVPAGGAVAVYGALALGPSAGRLPTAEDLTVLGLRIPLIRHPAMAGLAAKALLWLAATAPITAPR